LADYLSTHGDVSEKGADVVST